ncbi:LPS translocon maturation chaperone LptM [Halomonas ramblicola]|uniref:LPS translocon maturation chaperone LptM n=1 Tax=Halomonas ramblicola TaxID=747349 RepID=UPI0025B4DDCC|nr:lipoprotein [Halomonas ramblicola]MDN3522718.1 lipoprotein [Halomonas ramblicola]
MGRLSAAVAAALLLAALLVGCGQKGPLYLPGDEQAAEQYGAEPDDDASPDDEN